MKNAQRYKQITLPERVEIYALVQQGIPLQEIARRINRNVGTISRELKRNRSRFTKRYEPVKAQDTASLQKLSTNIFTGKGDSISSGSIFLTGIERDRG